MAHTHQAYLCFPDPESCSTLDCLKVLKLGLFTISYLGVHPWLACLPKPRYPGHCSQHIYVHCKIMTCR